MKIKIFSLIDWIMLLCVLSLAALGIVFIYSSAINQQGVLVTNEYVKQIIWTSLGIVLLFFAAVCDYRNYERYIVYIFGFLIFLLVITRLFGKTVNGAKAGLESATSEFSPRNSAKLSTYFFWDGISTKAKRSKSEIGFSSDLR